jgi:hypothetical protein
MSSANLDLVRSIYADWERGDFGSAGWAHPGIEYIHIDGADPGMWIGLTDVTRRLRDFLSAWGGWWTSAEEFRELDDGGWRCSFRAKHQRGLSVPLSHQSATELPR